MKNSFIILLSIISFSALAQTQQNINKNTGTVSNVLTTIDSIRFNGSSTNMEVVLQNGAIESHSISDIQNVNFISASQHSCGATNVHNPNLNYGSMTDQEGNVYKTIVIGTQEWMAENLKTSIYRNGDLILTDLDNATWSSTNSGAWTFYNNDSQYECPYGKLYNFYAVQDSRHVCPNGWHEPVEAEWTLLSDSLGGFGFSGGKMKTTGFQYWNSPNTDATNESGFSSLPGGERYSDFNGTFTLIGWAGNWWSSSDNFFSSTASIRNQKSLSGAFESFVISKRNGVSVRCLKD
jgi:uncharacterized protein (TIGR02145 family)